MESTQPTLLDAGRAVKSPAATTLSIYGPVCPSDEGYSRFALSDSGTVAHLTELLEQIETAAEHLLNDLLAQVNGEPPFSSPERLEQDRRRARLEEAQMHLAQFEALCRVRIGR